MQAATPLTLRQTGQSLCLDHITRHLLTSGTLKRYIEELSITGLTAHPTIFDQAITKSQDYDRGFLERADGRYGLEE
jgi:transaldolase